MDIREFKQEISLYNYNKILVQIDSPFQPIFFTGVFNKIYIEIFKPSFIGLVADNGTELHIRTPKKIFKRGMKYVVCCDEVQAVIRLVN